MKKLLFLLLVVLNTTLIYSQESEYNSTIINIDFVAYGGSMTYDQKTASVQPGLSISSGFRFNDIDSKIYIEVLGAYHSMYLYPELSRAKKEFYNSVEGFVGAQATKIFSIKLGLFYFWENSNTINNSFGVQGYGQFDIPIGSRITIIGNVGIGGNLSYQSEFGTRVQANIGASYNFTKIDY